MKKKIVRNFNNSKINSSYSDIFKHVSSLKIILFTVNARGGSGFFHSLIDSNPEIINMPEIRTVWDYTNSIKDMSFDIVADRFAARNPEIFNSSLNIIEGWDSLGKEANTYVTLDFKVFKNHFSELLKHIEFNEKNIFLILHISYWLTCNYDPTKAKVLFYHLHMAREPAYPFIPKGIYYEILHITRDPRIGFVRYQESVNKNKILWNINPTKQIGDYLYTSPSRLFSNFKSIISQVQIFKNRKDKLKIFTLEDLHEKRLKLINIIYKNYGLKELKNEPESTFWGINWHSDIKSEKSISGFQEGKRDFKYSKYLNFFDVFIIEYLTYKRTNLQGHKTSLNISSRIYNLILPIVFFLVLIPLSYEIKNIKNSIYNKNISKIILNFLYYSKRVFFCWNWLIKIARKNIFYPNQLS